MMDIAEIRKKAKSREQDKETLQANGAPDVEKNASPLEDRAETAAPEDVSSLESPPSGDDEGGASPETLSEGLDRLFSATDAVAMAIDETEASLLDSRDDDAGGATSQYLAFHLGKEEYALDITQISEIIKLREFTDIPRAPDYILGIISLRGVVVPVFDLQQRLNLGTSEMLASSRIIVCQLGEMTVGLLVDSINQVVNLVDGEVEPPPGVLSGLDRDMVHGIGRFQGRMIILLQLNSVLDVELS